MGSNHTLKPSKWTSKEQKHWLVKCERKIMGEKSSVNDIVQNTLGWQEIAKVSINKTCFLSFNKGSTN